ncbi:hypothetical protein HPB50_020180 [Hyalomma asiaticum]|uniref:Uncharacterized protein n=1 Tax=Hyalomma asiaticum TaxID=266040 RepID=A0ACB7TKV8_HYAAI|nr:hypothetical protein HPB50_020180 [Hyalomma asiaticum]
MTRRPPSGATLALSTLSSGANGFVLAALTAPGDAAAPRNPIGRAAAAAVCTDRRGPTVAPDSTKCPIMRSCSRLQFCRDLCEGASPAEAADRH